MYALRLATLAAGLAAAAGQQVNGDGFRCEFAGQSGGFKLYVKPVPGDNHTESSRIWNIRYNSIYELDAAGNKINSRVVHSLGTSMSLSTGSMAVAGASSPAVWVAGTAAPTGAFGNPVVVVRHTLVPAGGVLPLANGANFTAGNDTMKISINVTGWAFHSAADALAIDIRIADNGPGDGGEPDGDAHIRKREGGSRAFSLPGASDDDALARASDSGSPAPRRARSMAMEFEPVAYVDGDWATPVPVAVTRAGNVVTLVLPHFAQAAWYDPTVYATTASSGAAGSGASAVAVAASTLLVAAATALVAANL